MSIDTFTTGIEIEFNTSKGRGDVQRALSACGSDWTVKSDGSIGYGWEIVSPILSASDWEASLRAACDAIASLGDAYAGERCGLHVHLAGFERFEFHAVRNVARRYVNFEDTLDRLQPSARRGSANQYCKSNGAIFGADPIEQTQRAWKAIERCHSRRDLIRLFNPRDDRYRKLNLTSLTRHGTVEFRHHAGTIDFNEIFHWVRFLHYFTNTALEQQRLAKRPATTPESPADRLRKMLRNVPADTARYIRARFLSMARE